MSIYSYSWSVPSPVPAGSLDEALSQLFGQDLMFDSDFHLDSAGDYLLLDGKAALKQALYHRLLVSPGEYALRPEYGAGLARLVKRRMTRSEIDSIEQRIVEQLSRDDRIEKVVEVKAESYAIGDKPGIKVYVKILVVGEEIRLPFNFQDRT
jgi:phage baseplate assembly protein W